MPPKISVPEGSSHGANDSDLGSPKGVGADMGSKGGLAASNSLSPSSSLVQRASIDQSQAPVAAAAAAAKPSSKLQQLGDKLKLRRWVACLKLWRYEAFPFPL